MQEYKKQFIQFMVENEVLCFGDFTLKSGRKAPYFINAGKYRTGAQAAKLGYAEGGAMRGFASRTQGQCTDARRSRLQGHSACRFHGDRACK